MPTSESNTHTSHLFTVRVWQEQLAEGRSEWRGKVQYVRDGEAFYFRAWPELVTRIVAWLDEPRQADSTTTISD